MELYFEFSIKLSLILCTIVAPSLQQTPSPNITTTCGGVIKSLNGRIDYKLNETYDNNEACLWTIHGHQMKEYWIQLLEDGMSLAPAADWYDWISVFTVEKDWNALDLGENRIKRAFTIHGGDRTEYTVVGPIVYILFRSNAMYTNRGFSLRFHGIENDPYDYLTYTTAHFDNTLAESDDNGKVSGTYDYDGGRAITCSVVLQTRMTGQLKMFLSNFRNGYNKTGISTVPDDLVVHQIFHYEIPDRDHAFPIARYGKNDDGPFVTTSNFPLIIYVSGKVGDENKFHLEWEFQ